MMKMRSKVYLPEDLIVEILSRVPAVSLQARLRSTSKRWNALFKDGRFAKKHSATAPRNSSMALGLVGFRVYVLSVDLHGFENNIDPVKVTGQLSLKDPLSSSSEEVCIRGVFHCDGLLLCITKDHRLVVWNPLLGETKWIQPRNSDKESKCYALGYDNRSSCYKILNIDQFADRIPYQTEYQVYDFILKSWRVVGMTRDWFIQQSASRRRGLSVKGNTYWLAVRQDGPSHDVFLLSFDFSSERFQQISLPADAPRFYHNMVLSVTREEQQLCILSSQSSDVLDINVWMATKIESTGAISWSKFLTVTSPGLLYHSQFHYGMSFLVDHKKKVVVSCNSEFPNIIHIVGEDKYIQVDDLRHGAVPTRKSPPLVLLSYVPTLVQI